GRLAGVGAPGKGHFMAGVVGKLLGKMGGQQGNTLQAVRKELFTKFGDTVSVQTFSGESKQGVDEARAVVNGWLGFGRPQAAPRPPAGRDDSQG
ncbi:MAG: hypothetical protein ABWX93_05575, partial [Pseudoxanthomonas sp.]